MTVLPSLKLSGVLDMNTQDALELFVQKEVFPAANARYLLLYSTQVLLFVRTLGYG